MKVAVGADKIVGLLGWLTDSHAYVIYIMYKSCFGCVGKCRVGYSYLLLVLLQNPLQME